MEVPPADPPVVLDIPSVDLTGDPEAVLERLEEVPELRNAHARFFRAPGQTGVHVALLHSGPTNYQAPDGSWQPIDTRLVPSPTGYRNGGNSFRLDFPLALSSATPVKVELPQGSLSFTIDGALSGPARPSEESLLYPGVLTETDVEYRLVASGYVERVILRSAGASGRITYRIHAEGLTLSPGPGGQVLILAGTEEVGAIPAPFAEDANVDERIGEGVRLYDLLTSLADLGGGDYVLTVEVPQAWLADPARRYPVVIDPDLITLHPEKDTFVQSSILNTSQGGSTELRVGSYESDGDPEARTLIRFMIQSVRDAGNLIYQGKFGIYNFHSWDGTKQEVRLKRVKESWSESVTWPNQPAVGSTVWATHKGCGANRSGCDPWHVYNVKDLVQAWIDGTGNDGIRLHAPGPHPQSWKKYYSSEEDVGGDARPYLFVEVNAMPSVPQFDTGAPADGEVLETDSPSLKIKDVTDKNGDKDLLVRFQVRELGQTTWDCNTLNNNDIGYCSGWIEETRSHPVPSGKLKDGKTYEWRVQSWDGYDDLGRGYPTSTVRTFDLRLKKHGANPKWAMWSRTLGNDMDLSVNEANGNLVLEYPLDSLATPVGPLDLSLSYNSQAPVAPNPDPDWGLSPGWEVEAGPGSDASDIPVRLKKVGPDANDPHGVEIRYRAGRREYYPHVSGKIYGTVGGGTVRRHGTNSGWTLKTGSGSVYRFDDSGKLTDARPSTSTATQPGFRYQFDASSRIQWVEDPLLRRVNFTWDTAVSPARLRSISAWDGRSWTLGYDATTNRLASVTDPEGATVRFSYDGSGLLASVQDGEAAATGGPSTTMGYYTPSGATKPMVDWVKLPGFTNSWDFAYFAPFVGTFADHTEVTDPRGPTTTDATDYLTRTYFNTLGLPIRIEGPVMAGMAEWPQTRQLWDERGNILCRRSPAAVAATPTSTACTSSATVDDPLNTVYAYETTEPYRMLTVIRSAPNADGSGDRLLTTYAHDEGFAGLVAHYHKNKDLVGLPDALGISSQINANWGSGGPAEISGTTDNFSIRWTGEILADHASGSQTYKFRFYAHDGARLVVAERLLADCWGADATYQANCGDGDKSRKLSPGWHSIAVEFQALTGDAQVNLQWLKPGGSWVTVPSQNLRPNLGMVTSEKLGTTAPGAAAAFSTTTYVYDTNDAKLRGLPASRILSGPGSPDVTLSYTYDEFGRVRTETDASGVAVGYTYTGACETESVDREGLKIERACNGAGDVTDEWMYVGTTLQSDARHTITTYDGVGRVKQIDYPDGGQVVNTYDRAGRLKTKAVKVSATETRATDYTYTPQGWVDVETFPDPDGAGPQPRPTIDHDYDEVGNERFTRDVRGKVWEQRYDAANKVTDRLDPLLNRSTTSYDVAGNPVKDTTPSGVEVSRSFDLLGRVVQERIGTLGPATMTYDARGNATRVEDPDGVWVERSFDMASRVVSERAPVGDAGAAKTRTYTYDNRGNLTAVADYRGKTTSYTYDKMARIKTVTLPHAGPATTTYTYNEAGELTHVDLPTTTGAPSITWDYAYDKMGRLKTETDGEGNTTTYSYNLTGEQTKVDDPRPGWVDSVYDGAGRRIARKAYDGTGGLILEESFAFDPAGNLTAAQNSEETLSVTYDDSGRPDLVTFGGQSTDYVYDRDRLWKRIDPAGTTVLGYDSAGRLSSVTDPFTSQAASLAYTSGGRLDARSDASGLFHDFGYDPAGRLASEVATQGTTEVARFTSVYDPESNVTSRTRTVRNGPENGPWAYGYDDAGRLTSATSPTGITTAYGYDGAGNRISVQEGTNAAVTTAYDEAGRPTSSSDGTTYAHDGAGNLTRISSSTATWDYTYDPFGRLTAASKVGGPSLALAYDALDRLAERTKNSSTVTTYGYAGTSEELVSEVQGTETTLYASVLGAPLALKKGSSVRFFGLDPHGDVAYLVPVSSTDPVGWRTYDPWGKVRQQPGEQSTLGFQGDPTDPDTELVDMGVRLYAPGLGRFTTPDPLRGEPDNPLSLNRFLYGQADPVSMVDPTGLRPMCDGPGGSCGSSFMRSYSRKMSVAFSRSSQSYSAYHPRPYYPSLTAVREAAPPRPVPARPSIQPARRVSLKLTPTANYGGLTLTTVGVGGEVKTKRKIAGAAALAAALAALSKLTDDERPRFYRYVGTSEVRSIIDTSTLRGGRPGPTFFTPTRYDSARQAQSELAMRDRPRWRVEFEIVRSGPIHGPRKIEPKHGQPGGGIELWSEYPIVVRVHSFKRLDDEPDYADAT